MAPDQYAFVPGSSSAAQIAEGPGVLVSVIGGELAACVVTLYDSDGAATDQIAKLEFSAGAPIAIPFGVKFSTGLYAVTTSSSGGCTVTYW